MGSHSVTLRNKLRNEKSPYLLQHASNPVDWYPWGEDAFSKAKSENKLIFLSVGYSTCHWCHVMERESFENKEIANIMNKHFINIKVDREERPDVDRTYMTFVQAMSGGRGGWPMSVWLTPDLKPVFGGTYFPPHSNYGISSFSSVLTNLASKWQTNPERFIESGHQILEMLKESTFVSKIDDSNKSQLPDLKCINLIVQQLSRSFDNVRGGFNGAPKFPQPVNFNLLLQIYQRNKNTEIGKEALKMTEVTLKKMAAGGIHDHIGKGFARYSVDSEWHVPHFEKMLYDQAQLCSVYSQMYQVSGDSFYADIVRDICEYVNRDLSHPTGGCYSAEDADSLPESNSKEKREGAFYVWTYPEIHEILEEHKIPNSNISLAELFCYHFSVKHDGNVRSQQDPHGELINQNVLIIRGSLRETAEHFKIEEHIIANALKVAKDHLFHSRLKRPRPGLDDKMISSWNGLMLSGFCKAAQALGDDALKERALKLGHFIRKNLASEDGSTLLRSCYRNSDDDEIVHPPIPISGFLDDYAFVIRGLLDLHETCLEPEWLDWAVQLQETQDNLFWDENNMGYFFTSSEDETTLFRLKEEQDGAEPSGNSVAASNLFRLASLLESDEILKRSESLIDAFGPILERTPLATPEMCSVVQALYHGPIKIILTGQTTSESMKKFLSLIHLRLLPGLALGAIDPSRPPKSLHKIAQQFPLPENQQIACYVCSGRTCSLPTLDLEKFAELLDEALVTAK